MSTTNRTNEESDDEIDAAVREALSSDFVDAADLMSRGGTTVEIEKIFKPGSVKNSLGKTINKTVIAFKGAKKRFIVGKTNLKIIAIELQSDKSSQWKGKKITLTVRYLDEAFGQKNVPTVRVKVADESKLSFAMRKHYGTAAPKSRG